MPRASLRLLLLLPVLGALMVSAAPAAADTPLGHFRYAIRPNAPWPDAARTAQRHQYVVLHAWQADRMRQLKAANPGLRVLVYKNFSNTNDYKPEKGFFPTGVEYYAASAEHPEWFLTDTEGRRISLRNHSYLWAMDIGNRAYQEAWADNVAREVREQGWDGVFMDDVNPTIKYHATPSRVAKYPNDRAYAAATTSALETVVPRLRASGGKLVFANIGAWVEYPSAGSDWLRFLDGAMEEKFVKFGNAVGQGYRDEAQWTTQLNALKETQRRGKVFVGISASANDDAAAARYGMATMLLGSEGRAVFALQHSSDYGTETWFPDYDLDIGTPLGPEREAGGVHRRWFTRGQVLVNPTARAVTVELGGTYTGAGVSKATQITLVPRSGAVLAQDGPLRSHIDADSLDLVTRAANSADGVVTLRKRLTRAQTRRLTRGRKLSLRVRAPMGGRLVLRVRHRLRGTRRTRLLAATRRSLTRGGRHRVAARGRRSVRFVRGRATLHLRYVARR